MAPGPIIATSVAVLGVGALYALHHLRIRPKRLPAATLQFWHAAVRPQQTKVPWHRCFSHRRTFALLSAIVLLLAGAVALDRRDGAVTGGRNVIVIDTGDDSSPDSLTRRIDAAKADLPRLGADPDLISAGPVPERLSGDAEPVAVVGHRLAAIRPQAGPSLASAALHMAFDLAGDRGGRIHWYTAARALPDGLPAKVAGRVVLHAIAPDERAAIVGVQFEALDNGDAGGTLRIRVAGGTRVEVTTGGRTVAATAGPDGDAVLDRVAADGSDVSLRAADAMPVNYRLPDLRPIGFRFAAHVPRPLKLALGTVGPEAESGVFVGRDGETIPPDARAAILVVDQGDDAPAGRPVAAAPDAGVLAGVGLENAVASQGPTLKPEGISPLLLAGDAVLAGLGRRGGRPTLLVSSALAGEAADLPRRAAFPVLMRRLCETLTRRRGPAGAVAALRVAQDPLWTGPADGPPVDVIPVADRMPESSETRPTDTTPPVRSAVRWTDRALAAALALLLIESLLHVTRKIV